MRRPFVPAVLLAVLAAGCGGAGEPGSAPGADPVTALATPTVADVVDPAVFDFTATAVGGSQMDGAELVGKDVALWFWAPW